MEEHVQSAAQLLVGTVVLGKYQQGGLGILQGLKEISAPSGCQAQHIRDGLPSGGRPDVRCRLRPAKHGEAVDRR